MNCFDFFLKINVGIMSDFILCSFVELDTDAFVLALQ